MKLLTFRETSGHTRVAQLSTDNKVYPLSYPDGQLVDSLSALIASGIPLASLQKGETGIPLDAVQLLAPIPVPVRNIFCVGKNYARHAREFTRSGFDTDQTADVPASPIVFSKTPQTVIAHGESVWDAQGVSDALDYEAELAVIIGQGGRGIPYDKAWQHVWGYTIINDVTARDWQKRHQQWHMRLS